MIGFEKLMREESRRCCDLLLARFGWFSCGTSWVCVASAEGTPSCAAIVGEGLKLLRSSATPFFFGASPEGGKLSLIGPLSFGKRFLSEDMAEMREETLLFSLADSLQFVGSLLLACDWSSLFLSLKYILCLSVRLKASLFLKNRLPWTSLSRLSGSSGPSSRSSTVLQSKLCFEASSVFVEAFRLMVTGRFRTLTGNPKATLDLGRFCELSCDWCASDSIEESDAESCLLRKLFMSSMSVSFISVRSHGGSSLFSVLEFLNSSAMRLTDTPLRLTAVFFLPWVRPRLPCRPRV